MNPQGLQQRNNTCQGGMHRSLRKLKGARADASARVPALISRPAAEPSIHPGSTSSQQPKILLAFTILNAWVVSQVLVAPMDSDGAYDTASSGGSPDRREASASSGARTPSPAPPAKRTIDGEEACMSPALPAAPHSPFIMSNVNPGGTPELRVASPSPLAGRTCAAPSSPSSS